MKPRPAPVAFSLKKTCKSLFGMKVQELIGPPYYLFLLVSEPVIEAENLCRSFQPLNSSFSAATRCCFLQTIIEGGHKYTKNCKRNP